MSVGLAATKQEIDTRAGDTARNFQAQFKNVETLKLYLDSTPDQTLISMGYTAGEVAVLKGAINDLWQLRGVWAGLAALPEEKDFTQFVKQLWGVGAF